MKKIITLLVLVVSFAATASTHPLKIINNTPYYFDYMMTTTFIGYSGPGYGFPLYRNSNLITLAPYSTVVYDDPTLPGLPFNLFPGTWDYYPVDWNSYTQVTSWQAFARDSNKQEWASCKFNVYKPGPPDISMFSGHFGPAQGGMLSGNGNGISITWVQSGGSVTIVVS